MSHEIDPEPERITAEWRMARCIQLVHQFAASNTKPPTLAQIEDYCKCSRPTAIKLRRAALEAQPPDEVRLPESGQQREPVNDAWRMQQCQELYKRARAKGAQSPSLTEVQNACHCTRSKAVELRRRIEGLAAPPKEINRNSRLSRGERAAAVRELIADLAMQGREPSLDDVVAVTGSPRSTAQTLLNAARRDLAESTAKLAMVIQGGPIPMDTVPSPGGEIARSATPAAGGIGSGIDMLGTLQHSARKLHAIARDLQDDIKHARYFVLGSPANGYLPGYCRKCGTEMASELTVNHKPAGLQVGYSDLATLARSATQTEVAIAKIVDTYNGVLAQLYHYGAMQNYIADVKQAILNVVPESARAIANELKRLQARSGGAHGNSTDPDNRGSDGSIRADVVHGG